MKSSSMTFSRKSLLSSYKSLMASAGGYIITIPSRPGSPGVSKPSASPYRGVQKSIDSWAEFGRNFIRAFNENKIREIRDLVVQKLNTGNSTTVVYDIYFHIDIDGEVHIDSILPANIPVWGTQDHVLYYKERIAITTDTPEKIYSDQDPLVLELEEKLNKEYLFKKAKTDFEKDLTDIPVSILRRIREYKDPPTQEEMDKVGRIA